MNIIQILKTKVNTVYARYLNKDIIEELPIYYIAGSQTLPPPLEGNEEEEAALLASLIQNDVRVSSFVRDTGNLEEVFMRVTGNKEVLSA